LNRRRTGNCRVTWDKTPSGHGGCACIMHTGIITPCGLSTDEFPYSPVIDNERISVSCMTKVGDAPPAATDGEQLALLNICERDVLKLLGTGCSLRTVARHLALSDGTVKSHVRELLRKLHLASTDALREPALALRDCRDEPGPFPDEPTAILHRHTGTLGAKHGLLAGAFFMVDTRSATIRFG